MRSLLDILLGIREERSRQFRIIKRARKRMLKWARARGISLRHIEYVVPFVDTDFSLSAWLFYATRRDVKAYALEGISEEVKEQLRTVLREVGYPTDWLALVRFRFASKEEVDEGGGSYRRFVR